MNMKHSCSEKRRFLLPKKAAFSPRRKALSPPEENCFLPSKKGACSFTHLLVYSFASLLVYFSTSCTETSEGFLENKQEALSLNEIFSDSLKTMQFQAAIYWKIPAVIMGPQDPRYYLQSFFDYDSSTDNAREKSTDRKNFAVAFSKADFTQDGINANFSKFLRPWIEMYQNIRVCNQFLENYPRSPISQGKKERLEAETRFLRAFYYFHLLRNWGGVPLVGNEMLNPFENHEIQRATFEETVQYIADEFTYAKERLPYEQTGNDYGRPTKGAALAMLAKLYFYAASPLYNGENVGSGNNRLLTGYDDFQLSRWETAKNALDSFFIYNEERNLYELLVNDEKPGYGFYQATTSRVSRERVWMWLSYAGHTWPHEQLLPASRQGQSKVSPYHDLTEAFPTKDGVEIRSRNENGEYKTVPDRYNTNNKRYDPSNPYKDRDPRFNYTFLYNNALWSSSKGETPKPVYTYRGAASDGIFTGATATGYYFVKLCVTNITGKESGTTASGHGQAFIRYADLLLMQAEVLTELDLNANRSKIEDLLFQIRRRAGIEPGDNNRYGIPENMRKDDMIAFILNERRIEFVLEGGNRFWDLKRRKLFEKLNNEWSHAAVWEKYGDDPNGNPIFTWSVQPLEQHFFDVPRMYHFPIPLKEYESSHGTLIQNPGW
jgi:hypothetical protein